MTSAQIGLQLRRDTATNWTSSNPVLKQGEPGLETTSGKLKIGDGTTPWTSLPYLIDDEIVRDIIGATLRAGTNVSLVIDDNGNTVTINSSGSGSGVTDPEVVRDTIAAALVAGTNVTITPSDAANTITISATDTTDAEVVRDTIGATLVAGPNVTITPNDAANTITIAATGGGSTDPEVVRDTIGATLVAGANVTITPNDDANTITITGTNTTDPEIVRDTIGATLVAGANVTITPNDGANTITIAGTGGGSTDPEVVRDTIGATLVAGTGISITVDDNGNTIIISASSGGTTTPPPTTTTPTKIEITSVTVEGTSATVNWKTTQGTDGAVITGVASGRDGVDSNNSGPWDSPGTDPITGSRTFYNLVPGVAYTFRVQMISNGTPFGSLVSSAPTTIPSTSTGSSVIFSDAFPQANGAALDPAKWALGKNPAAGGGVTVQNNTAQFLTGTGGGYSSDDAVGRRLLMADVADFDLTVDIMFDGEVYPRFWFRSDRTDEPFGSQGYQLNLMLHRLEWNDNWNTTNIATDTQPDYAHNVWYTLRIRAVGTKLQARIWLKTATEPTAWNLADATHSGKTVAGMMGLMVGGGGDPASQRFLVDNVNVTTPGGTVTPPPTPTPTTGGFLSGASVEGINPTSTTSGPFYTWRGGTKPLAATATWADDSINTTQNIWSFTVDTPSMGNFPGLVDVAIGGLYPGEGDTWAQAAAGAYDSRFTTVFNILAQYRRNKPGIGETWVRPFHEFNGNWYPWSLHNQQEVDHFITTWRRIHAIKQQIFPEAKMHWSPNRENAGMPIISTAAWPGDAYVDAIGVDFYFQWPGYPDQAAWDAGLDDLDALGGPKGLDSWRQFAISKGKPLCFPEWGTNSGPGEPVAALSSSGKLDQPAAITSFLNWCEAHQGSGPGQVPYAIYFNGYNQFRLYPTTESPLAAAAYRNWHGSR